MKIKSDAGRTAKGSSISMQPELWAAIDEKLERCRPRISRSLYMQRLAEIDLEIDILGLEPLSSDESKHLKAKIHQAVESARQKAARHGRVNHGR